MTLRSGEMRLEILFQIQSSIFEVLGSIPQLSCMVRSNLKMRSVLESDGIQKALLKIIIIIIAKKVLESEQSLFNSTTSLQKLNKTA